MGAIETSKNIWRISQHQILSLLVARTTSNLVSVPQQAGALNLEEPHINAGIAVVVQQNELYQLLKSCAEILGIRTRRGEPKGWVRFARNERDLQGFRAGAANEMERIHYSHDDRITHKWHGYLAAYDKHAAHFRGKEVAMLEIGVCHGGSLQVWKKYLGAKARIYGLDLLSVCKEVAEPQIEIFACDTSRRDEVKAVSNKTGPLDIVVDDGSHVGSDQRTCFEEFFPRMRDGGVYFVEDLQCSYWRDFGGGYRKRGTFVEYAKEMIDRMHAWYISDERSNPDEWFANNIRSISFYDGIVAIEKGPKAEPAHVRVGVRALALEEEIKALKAEGRWPL